MTIPPLKYNLSNLNLSSRSSSLNLVTTLNHRLRQQQQQLQQRFKHQRPPPLNLQLVSLHLLYLLIHRTCLLRRSVCHISLVRCASLRAGSEASGEAHRASAACWCCGPFINGRCVRATRPRRTYEPVRKGQGRADGRDHAGLGTQGQATIYDS